MNPTSILAVLLIVAFATLGTAKLAAAPAMRAKAEHVGFSVSGVVTLSFLLILVGDLR